MESDLRRAERAVQWRQWPVAVRLLRQWLLDHSDDRRAHELLALCHFEMGQWEKALAPAQQAVQLDPSRARAWCNLGAVLRKLGRFDEAEAAQQKALELDPAYRRAYVELQKIERDRRIVPVCVICRTASVPDDVTLCPGCGAVLHSACAARAENCPACGYSLVSKDKPPAHEEAKAETTKTRVVPRWLLPVAAIVFIGLLAAGGFAVVRQLNAPGLRGWRTFEAAVRCHAQGDYAGAIRLYEDATSIAPGLAAAYVAWAWAELELCPFSPELQDIRYRMDAEESLLAQLEDLAQQAKWGATRQLDRADGAANAALQALKRKGAGYEEQLSAGLAADETAAFAYATMAMTALLRASAGILAFVDQFENALVAPGRTSTNLAALRRSTALAQALGWCNKAERLGHLADRQAPEMHLGPRIVASARETAQTARRISCLVASVEETTRALEQLQTLAAELLAALSP